MPCGDLHPPPVRPAAGRSALRASCSQAVHSRDTIQTTLVSLRKRASRRSSTVTMPSLRASRIAVRTVVSETPATAAMCPTVSRQSPLFTVSAATSESTACSASVNRAARPGGSRPEAAQRRRRSIEASVRGREPTAFLGLATGAGAIDRSSMSPASASASASDRCPSPNAFHSADSTAGNAARGAASAWRRIS